jgi:anti-sigma factor RsiW
MNCSRELIEAYLDQELDAPQHAALEQHMATCPDCSEAYARLRDQKVAIKASAPYYYAPPELEGLVRRELRRSGREERTRVLEIPWRWLTVAASLLLVASISWNLVQLRQQAPNSDVAGDVLSDHLRSLLGTHLVDVPSSDQHTVKPWFAGKLDFSPDVKDLEAQGFPLVGGRIEYVAGRRVAALVYRRRQHVINLFIWPDTMSTPGESRSSRNGYNLLHWTAQPMTYWAVSDVSAAELENLRRLYR